MSAGPQDVREWLRALGLEQYCDVFERNDIDWEVLPDLDHEALKDMGVSSAGHRLRILKAAKLLGEPITADSNGAPTATDPKRFAASGGEAERRQLTVMFCDLVGSTPLSQRLDPEQLRDVIRSYQDACAGAVSRFDGYIAQFLGDGVMVYFGFPRAHEDDAERAGHAALELLAAMPRLPALESGELQIRIGIATGMVVVGDIVGQAAAKENMVVGDTPNLAARLQSVAQPGTVIVSDRTRQLAADRFIYAEAKIGTLKGFDTPIRAWRIIGERRGQSRFDARHATRLGSVIGRELEVELLLERWRQASSGEGQLVLLSGEAGIGKSRVVEALRERIAHVQLRHLRYQCSPYHAGSPFHPVIRHLEFAAGLTDADSDAQKLVKLQRLLAQSSVDAETVALIASLLSIALDRPEPVLQKPPQEYRAALLQALLRTLEGLATHHPVLFFIEDLHWVDPSTAEMLELIINRLATLRVLLVATYRPDYVTRWMSHAHCTVLTLNRLSRDNCVRLIRATTAERDLPSELVDQIIAKTDGVPLFVEELTKTILASGMVLPTNSGYALTGALVTPAIPSTLQDSLMARLDQRPEVREIAQLASVIGRQFSHAILEAVAEKSASALQAALDELLAAGLIFRHGIGTDATYEFKHALVCDTAYQSMLKTKRAQHHAAIAQAIESRFTAMAERDPAILAHHYTEAGLTLPAIRQWRNAAEQAVARSAGQEAAAHLRTALALLDRSSLDDRLALELAIRIDLGPVLMTIAGFAAQETIDCYRRARELCDHTGDRSHLFPATWGIWFTSNHLGQREALRLADELIAIGEAQSDSGLLLEAYHAAWTTGLRDGDLRTTYDFAAKGIEIYRADVHHHHTFVYGGHDPGVCCRIVGALVQCLRGYSVEARSLCLAAVRLAEQVGHPFSLALATSFSATVFALRREPDEVTARAQQLESLCDRHGFPQIKAMGPILAGWALAAQGRAHEGMPLMEEGLESHRRLGVKRLSFPLNLMAEAYGWAGDLDRAFALLREAEAVSRETAEHRWEAELCRIEGDLHVAMPVPDYDRAKAAYRRALEVSSQQDAKLFMLRAATGIARILAVQGNGADADAVLAPVVNQFPQRDETQDMRDARSLLGTLAC